MKKLLSILFFVHVAHLSMAQQNNLEYFIQSALANSPLLKDYESQLSSLELDNRIFLASLKPQVNGVSNNFYAPVIGGWGYDNAITNGQQLSALIAANKSLLNKKTIASQLESLKIQGQATINSSKISEQDIKKTVAEQYITVFGEQMQIDFYNRVNKMLLKEDSILKKLTQDNVYKQSDYLAFAVTKQQQLLSSSQLEVQYNFDYAGLNYIAGIVDTSVRSLSDPNLYTATIDTSTASLFYKQFELDSLKLINERGLVDGNYRPKINLFADAGYNSSFSYKGYKNFGTSIGVDITIPIYDHGQRKIQYSKIDIQERNRLFKKEVFARQRSQQILQLIQQLNSTEQQISQINKQIKYTETLITVNEKLLATGDIRLTDFILALNNYFTAKNLLTQNYITRIRIINQLNYWGK
jgi:outer membrane protein TolC